MTRRPSRTRSCAASRQCFRLKRVAPTEGRVESAQEASALPILIRGKTVCSLCGRVINEGEEVTMFSAFIPNELDPLLIFHDGAFHAGCFRRHPLSAEADRRCNESLERTGPGHRKCTVCDV